MNQDEPYINAVTIRRTDVYSRIGTDYESTFMQPQPST